MVRNIQIIHADHLAGNNSPTLKHTFLTLFLECIDRTELMLKRLDSHGEVFKNSLRLFLITFSFQEVHHAG